MATGYYTSSFMAMGTRCDLVIIDSDADKAERITRSIQHETLQLEHLLSRFNPESQVSKFNALAAGEEVALEEPFWTIFSEMKLVNELTFGVFDVTAGAIIRLWKDRPADTMVHPEDVENAKSRSGFDKIAVDTETKTVTKLADGLELDFGAVGKGIALDRIKDLLKVQKVLAAFISFGESSILGWGKHPNGPYWPVGIPDPTNHPDILHTFQIVNQIITSSGSVSGNDSQGYRRRRHLVDPRSGVVTEGDWLVSVKSDSALKGEVISSAWRLLSSAERQTLRNYASGTEVLEVSFEEERKSILQLTTI